MTFLTNVSVTTTGDDKAEEAFDLNDATSWTAKGKGQFLEFFFDKTVIIDKIDIKFGKAGGVFDLYYYYVNNYNFYKQIEGKPDVKEFQTIDVEGFENITRIKIVGQNDENEIVDVRFLSEADNCCKPDCTCECVDPKPDEEDDLGFEKKGGWGADLANPEGFKVVNMKNAPELFKVVDAKDVNVRTDFKRKKSAEDFIKNAIKNKPDEPDNPDVPKPKGDNVTTEGVKLPYKITGKIETVFRHNDRADGKRMDFAKLKKGEFVNSAVLGYFAFPKGKAPKDEVSGKWSVEGHSDGTDPKCYDLGIEIYGGAARYRFESPHPKYTNDLGKEKEKGVTLDDKFVGYMFIRRNLPSGNVALEIWQDAGDNEGKQVSNQWKQLAYWEDSKYKITNYPNGPQVTIRIDGSNVVKDLKLKHVQVVELA